MTDQKTNKAINISLWVAQGFLALTFLMAGGMKAFQPTEALVASLPWVADTPAALVKFIGVSEFLGGIGLLLPSILRIKPKLTVWAAIGLALVMLLAAGFHGSRGEYSAIGANALFIVVCLFVAYGRTKHAPILAK